MVPDSLSHSHTDHVVTFPRSRSTPAVVSRLVLAAHATAFLETRDREPDRDERELLIAYMGLLVEEALDVLWETYQPRSGSVTEAAQIRAALDDPALHDAAQRLYTATQIAQDEPVGDLVRLNPGTRETFERRVLAFVRMGSHDQHVRALTYAVEQAGADVYGDPARMPAMERRHRQIECPRYIRRWLHYLDGSAFPDDVDRLAVRR